MDNRTITFMTVAVIVCVGLLLGINLLTIVRNPSPAPIDSSSVIKIAVVSNKQEHVFTPVQQNFILTLLKQSQPADKNATAGKGTPPDFEKLILYRDNAPNIEITPISYIGSDLLFSTPDWNSGAPLQDTSHGVLKGILSQPIKEDANKTQTSLSYAKTPKNLKHRSD